MTEYAAVAATQEHADHIAANMNEADVAEIWASSRMTPHLALTMAVVSRDTRVGLADGVPICMFGCQAPSLLSDVAVPWLLGSKDISKHGRRFLRESKVYFAEMTKKHGVLVNYVDVRHKVAVRWLAWLGFTLEPAYPHGPDKLPFHRFYAVSDHV